MSHQFKQKLSRLYTEAVGRFGAGKHDEAEYKRIIRFGALGDMGEKYFLYIYRDMYRNAAYYGAVVFLNKPDGQGNPVTIHCLEQDGVEQTRNIYIRAALYFLRNDYDNTMEAAGKAKYMFSIAREKINSYIQGDATPLKELEDFNFNVDGQEVTYTEVENKTFTRQLENRNLKRQLRKLKEKTLEEIGITPVQTNAALGLHLRIGFVNLTGEKNLHFYPLAIPVKINGQPGRPRKLGPADIDSYRFNNLTPVLENFVYHYRTLEAPAFNDPQRAKTINYLYYSQLVDEIFVMPDELKFCQSPDLAGAFNPLKTFRFNKIAVRFAPSLKKDAVFKIRLSLIGENDAEIKRVDAGDSFTIKITEQAIFLFFTSSDGDNYFSVPEEVERFRAFFNFINDGNEFYICDFQDVLKALQGLKSPFIEVDAGLLKRYTLDLKPAPVLKICMPDAARDIMQRLVIDFDYRREILNYLKANPDKEVFTYNRHTQFESMCHQLLKTDPLLKHEMEFSDKDREVCSYYNFNDGNFIEWIIQRGGYYMDKGFRVYVEEWNRFLGSAKSKVNVAVKNDIDWLEFKPTIQMNGDDDGIAIESVDMENSMVIDKKGKIHLLTREELEKLKDIYQYGEKHHNVFRIPSRNHILVSQLYDERMSEMPEVEAILSSGKKLEQFDNIKDAPVSSKFKGTLRHYQQEGFNWLRFLHDYTFPGCLADDMGLGKTVQTLALLQTLRDENKLDTSLLVAPVSAIPNWEAEIQRFTNRMAFKRHIGVKRDKDTASWNEYDLIITSYATMRNDIELFSDFSFDYIILDESQNIKNYTSGVSRAAKVIKAKHRLALSGTPIENNTMELWSLFDFLLTGYLGSYRWFNRQFSQAIEREKDGGQAELLKKMIFPFIMRRKKEDVELELPEKIEIVHKFPMEYEQARLYSETARAYHKTLEDEIDKKGVARSSMKILEGMLKLRQICLFPRLADKKYAEVPSAKFDHFRGLIEDILAEDHKVLIFSQFVEALKLLKGHFDESGIQYSYIDGGVNIKEREKTIKAFQEEPERRVFLLSLKAGGVAINLTAADYVVIFDPWWNPAVEAQAIDRSHRFGQTRKVLVYRMVIENSIEEKMLQLQEKKKELVENLIVSDGGAFKNLKKEDILNLF